MANVDAIHIGQALDPATLDALADFICGDDKEDFPAYRSSMYLTQFFQSVNINATHDGSTRKRWVLDILRQLQPSQVEVVILRLVDLREYRANQEHLGKAVKAMQQILLMENLAIGYDQAKPYLKRTAPLELDADKLSKPKGSSDEDAFLSRQFPDQINIGDLNLDPIITGILQSRVNELIACQRDKVPLGSIFLLGSTLEGLLLAVAAGNPRRFMSATAAPKDSAGRTKNIYDWNLNNLIDVAYEVSAIALDVKKFSHVLRDFRNYIHPYEQMSKGFNPDQHTVDICWQVFKAAFNQIKSSV